MELISVDDASQVFAARSAAARLAASLGMSASQAAKLALIVTEAGTNLVKHARSGVLLLSVAENDPRRGIDVLSIDRGPGMADIQRCLGDGFSTAGSPGTGLGAIRRQANFFDIHSDTGRGTVLMARVHLDDRPSIHPACPLEIGAVTLPVKGETVCGDSWGMAPHNWGAMIMVADGLGHGPLAAEASVRAVACVNDGVDPSAVLTHAHNHLRGTRGAALGVAKIDLTARRLDFAGVGNISGTILGDDGHRSMVSHPGIVGQEMRKVQQFGYDLPTNWVLVLHSDGLTSRWDLAAYPGLARRHPGVAAAVLWRDFTRGRDDVTVVVARVAP